MTLAFIAALFVGTLAPCLASDRKRIRSSHARKRAMRVAARARLASVA